MRPSANRHVLVALRKVLGLNQTDFSEVADCSASTNQAIELGRLRLSDFLAKKIAVATNVSRTWLLKNKLDSPPVTDSGLPYTREDYVKAQIAGKKQRHPVVGQYTSIALYARMRAITSAAAKRGASEFRMAHYELDNLLTELEKKYGWDEKIYPVPLTKQPNFLSALKLARNDVEIFEVELCKADDAPDRLIPPAALADHRASIETHEHAKAMKQKRGKH